MPKLATLLCASALLFSFNALAAPDAARLKAAEELLLVMDLEKTFSESIKQQVDLQVRQNPMIAPFREVMLEFFEKYMSWESLKGDMANIYAEAFTVEEIKDLVKFYNTPTGKKASLKLPELASKGAELGMTRVQKHMPELQSMIQKKMASMGQK
ncbi:DUF2059 domain-containing protein [Myxococcota bacterium]|nr:DUF2059 domain-containing protein [Myxococcota bacterium]MBU1429914.1 DUF2059 domain-containing protein [Myxococcota bacterium]MBU1898899.1 DUF2059 domain-containing protein [Myxococcota bacterium]